MCKLCAHDFCTVFVSGLPGTQAGSVLRTISAQSSRPGPILLKSAAVQDRGVSILDHDARVKETERERERERERADPDRGAQEERSNAC